MTTVWDESYPPSVLFPEPPEPPVVIPTGATAGTPGAWTPPGSTPPVTLAGANGLGLALGAAWAEGTWVDLGGAGDDIHWDGTAFVAGITPAPPAPPEEETAATPTRRRRASKTEEEGEA